MQIYLNSQTFIQRNNGPKKPPAPPKLLRAKLAKAAAQAEQTEQLNLSGAAKRVLALRHRLKARGDLKKGLEGFAGGRPLAKPHGPSPRPKLAKPHAPAPRPKAPAPGRPQAPNRTFDRLLPADKHTQGEPQEWYFNHGEYEHKTLEGGIEVMQDGSTRVLYNSNTKTGRVYKNGENGWVLDEVRTDWSGKAASPILLDMDGDGQADVANGEWKPHAGQATDAKKIQFDLNGDGRKETTEWYGGNDGLLVKLSDEQLAAYQTDGSLEISGQELYGDQGGTYKDGYDKMSQLADTDKDGRLSGDELDGHYVWMDKNTDGVMDQGELQTTAEAGITSVNTTHDGNYQSSFVRNGQEQKSWDWWPTTWG